MFLRVVTGIPSPTAAALEACWGLTPQEDNRAVPENPMGTGIGKALISPPPSSPRLHIPPCTHRNEVYRESPRRGLLALDSRARLPAPLICLGWGRESR